MKKDQMKTNRLNNLLPVLILLFATVFQLKAQDKMKRYPIASAKITYTINSPEGTGTKVLFFDHYGRRESSQETLQKHGKTIKNQLTLLNEGKAYSIDLLKNKGEDMSQSTGMAMQMMTGATGNDMSATGKKILEGMGGQKVGAESFLGKNCEKWEVNTMGKTTTLLWKGIPLKTVTSVMGIKSTEQATSVKTGQSFSNADFEPPAGVKIEKQEMSGMGMGAAGLSAEDRQQMEKLKNMSYADFKKMALKNNPNMKEQDIQQAYKMMKQMSKMIK